MATPGKLDFELVTPYRRVHHLDADEVICPGVHGEFGVLPGHAPLLARLKPGVLGFRQGTEWRYVALTWGLCEVANDRVSVLVTTADPAEEIDPQAAARARDAAEAKLKALEPGSAEAAEAQTELEKALAQLQTVRWQD
ncbi:MAG TPA: ATP synthase F1 subunit epsilon [Thermodesulfobacteriota bacterium]